MDVSFVETMRGTLRTPDGEESTAEFDVVAQARSVRRFLRDGRTELRGLLRAPRWADEVPAAGTLTLSPHELCYRVEFADRGGRRLRLEGKKHPSVLRLLTSMTTMDVALFDAAGAHLAEGEMRFALRDLSPFLLSWLPVGRWAQRAVDARRRAVAPSSAPRRSRSGEWMTPRERAALRALAEAAMPPSGPLPGADARTVERTENLLSKGPASVRQAYRAGLWAFELRTLATHGRRFSSMPLGRRLDVLQAWYRGEATRLFLRGLVTPLKVAHFDAPEIYRALELRRTVPPPARPERPRWRDRILDAGAQGGNVELECEVVVVGTGAGGAPVAAELASRGVAVLMLEEGEYFSRSDFNGRTVDFMQRAYRRGGATFAVGNTVIPIPTGKTVGGTTTINSGTCFRPPEPVLLSWAAQGLTGLAPRALEPYVDRVWEELQVGPSSPEALGRVATLIAKGCDRLGWSHHPLDRNAPGCDGQGLCCFGCPSEAKRSSNVSWVPKALGCGAQVLTGVRVARVLLEGERAVGVEGTAQTLDGRSVSVRVRAPVVVLACGTLNTPKVLLQQGLCNASGELGKNLSIHPAVAGVGLFDEAVNGARTVPQGYAIDQFVDEGIYFEGGSVPVELQAGALLGMGPAFMEAMEHYNHMLQFGFMVKDTSRGRVRAADGEPLITYWLNHDDLGQLHRGLGLLARVYFAAGAREVHLPVFGWERLRALSDVEAFERASVAARHVDLTAYHPLGTARLGIDPFSSVVGPDHETHDVENLFVCDGSAVPGPPGVNPQVTIMAMALRAAGVIARRVERLTRHAA